MEKLKLAAGMTGEQKRYAVEAALLLGFQTETATFPVITADGEIPVPENMEELKALWKKSTGGTPEEYESASKHTGPIFDLDFRKEKGLETMLQKGDFLKDENQDLLPDVLDVKIVLPEDADDAVAEALCKAWERREQLRSPDKMRCSLQHVTWHGVLVWRQPDIKELLRQMQLIQVTGSFWKKQSRQSLYGKKKEKV